MSKSMILLCIIVRQSSIVVLLSKLKPTTVAVPRPPGADCSCCRQAATHTAPRLRAMGWNGEMSGNFVTLYNFQQSAD